MPPSDDGSLAAPALADALSRTVSELRRLLPHWDPLAEFRLPMGEQEGHAAAAPAPGDGEDSEDHWQHPQQHPQRPSSATALRAPRVLPLASPSAATLGPLLHSEPKLTARIGVLLGGVLAAAPTLHRHAVTLCSTAATAPVASPALAALAAAARSLWSLAAVAWALCVSSEPGARAAAAAADAGGSATMRVAALRLLAVCVGLSDGALQAGGVRGWRVAMGGGGDDSAAADDDGPPLPVPPGVVCLLRWAAAEVPLYAFEPDPLRALQAQAGLSVARAVTQAADVLAAAQAQQQARQGHAAAPLPLQVQTAFALLSALTGDFDDGEGEEDPGDPAAQLSLAAALLAAVRTHARFIRAVVAARAAHVHLAGASGDGTVAFVVGALARSLLWAALLRLALPPPPPPFQQPGAPQQQVLPPLLLLAPSYASALASPRLCVWDALFDALVSHPLLLSLSHTAAPASLVPFVDTYALRWEGAAMLWTAGGVLLGAQVRWRM